MMWNRINDLPLFEGGRVEELKLVGSHPVDTESIGSDVFTATLAGRIPLDESKKPSVGADESNVDPWWNACKWDD